MGDLLGLGVSHYPPLSGRDEEMAGILRWTLDDPDIPGVEKDPGLWPDAMRSEWGDDGGITAARAHRSELVAAFKVARRALDDFAPDVVLIWGDDQYENFREDIIPPYSVLAYSDLAIQPWKMAQESSNMVGKPNAWDEPPETSFLVRGTPDVAKALVTALTEGSFPTAYSYTQLHHPGLPHAFLNAILYLDYDRRGFDYPVIPFPVNCYGRKVVSYKGFLSRFGEKHDLDPPSPSPAHMMNLGAAVAQFFAAQPWRVALVASSSWSHAFLCDKTWRLRPDTGSDMEMYQALTEGDTGLWRSKTVSDLERAGQQEMLNWFCLVGAMEEMGRRKPDWATLVRTEVFNSNKAFCVYEDQRLR